MDVLPLKVVSSKWPFRISAIVATASIVGMWQANLSATYLLICSLLLVAILLRTHFQHIHRQLVQISCIDGLWRLTSSYDHWHKDDEWSLEGDYSWHPWVISLKFKNRNTKKALIAVLYPDSADPEVLRVLRVKLLHQA